ncbi:MAG: hypothetical protein QXS69_01355 [Candidatus Aenigmatarchaeota archaeon]
MVLLKFSRSLFTSSEKNFGKDFPVIKVEEISISDNSKKNNITIRTYKGICMLYSVVTVIGTDFKYI